MPGKEHHNPPAALRPTSLGTLLLLILLAGAGVRFGLVNPGRNWQLDFRSFYTVGTATLRGVDPYNTPHLRETIAKELPGDQKLVGYAYPPPTLPLMALFARLPLQQAQIAWACFQFALLLVGMLFIFRAAGIPFGSPVGVLVGTVFWLSMPVEALFRWGQFDGIRVACVGAAVYFLSRSHAARAGTALALAAIAKVYPAAYFLVLLVRRQWRGAIAGAVVAGVLLGIGFAWIGPAGRASYFGNNANEFSGVDMVIAPQNMSLIGFLHRAFVDNPAGGQPSRAWFDLGAQRTKLLCFAINGLVLLLTAVWLWRQRRTLTAAECVAGMVPAVLLVELNTWPHHCVPMLIPLAFAAAAVARVPRAGWLDLGWLGSACGLYLFCPVYQYDLALPPALEHLAGPTITYAVGLTWLFFQVRYPRLVRAAAGQTAVMLDAPRRASHNACGHSDTPVMEAAAPCSSRCSCSRPSPSLS